MVSELSGEEAKALVQALITASTTVEAWYIGNGIDTAVVGVVRMKPDGQYCVSQAEASVPHISIDPNCSLLVSMLINSPFPTSPHPAYSQPLRSSRPACC